MAAYVSVPATGGGGYHSRTASKLNWSFGLRRSDSNLRIPHYFRATMFQERIESRRAPIRDRISFRNIASLEHTRNRIRHFHCHVNRMHFSDAINRFSIIISNTILRAGWQFYYVNVKKIARMKNKFLNFYQNNSWYQFSIDSPDFLVFLIILPYHLFINIASIRRD